MLADIYYLVGLIFVWDELRWLIEPKERIRKAAKYGNLAEVHKDKEYKEYDPKFKKMVNAKMYILIPFTWLVTGLFSSNWLLFLVYWLVSIFVIAPIAKANKYNQTYLVLHWIWSLVGFVFAMFVILNHFHLHINVMKELGF